MLASEIIQYAKHGELRQLSVKDDDQAIISYINLGIIALYKKFKLSIKTEIIKTVPDVKVYQLRSNDISQVLTVYNSKGEQLVDKKIISDNDYDITQINYNTFLLTKPKDEELMFLYKAVPKLVNEVTDEIDIPYDMLEALLNYIAYKAYSTIGLNNVESISNSTAYLNKFEKSCYELTQLGYEIDLFHLSHSVQMKGFV